MIIKVLDDFQKYGLICLKIKMIVNFINVIKFINVINFYLITATSNTAFRRIHEPTIHC